MIECFKNGHIERRFRAVAHTYTRSVCLHKAPTGAVHNCVHRRRCFAANYRPITITITIAITISGDECVSASLKSAAPPRNTDSGFLYFYKYACTLTHVYFIIFLAGVTAKALNARPHAIAMFSPCAKGGASQSSVGALSECVL